METKDKELQVLCYLQKNYSIIEDKFICRDTLEHKWGARLEWELGQIFSYDPIFTESILKYWAFNNGLSEDKWLEALNPKFLRVDWTPELAQDINAFHSIDAEAELTALLSQELAQEIDRDIVNQIFRLANEG